MDPKALALLSSALSALIAALGYYAKTRQERLRTTRSVLYQLLELHHHLSVFQYMSGRFLSDYLTACQSVLLPLGVEISKQQRSEIEAAGKVHFQRYMHRQIEEMQGEVVKPYQEALQQLAKENPILAFRLRGKESLVLRTPATQALFEIPIEDESTAVSREVQAEMLADMDALMRESTLSSIAEGAKMVSFQCGAITYVRTLLLLRRARTNRIPTDVTGGIESGLRRVLARVIESERRALDPARTSN